MEAKPVLILFCILNIGSNDCDSVKGLELNYDYTKYHPMVEISNWMWDMEKLHPELISSAVYGQTFEGRNITLMKMVRLFVPALLKNTLKNRKHYSQRGRLVMDPLTMCRQRLVSMKLWEIPGKTLRFPWRQLGLKNPEEREKKVIWMDCGIHAREWIAPAFCQWFVKEMVQSFKTRAHVKQMLENLDFYVTPVINVDGYLHSWVDNSTRRWRKSRSAPPPGSSCYGVDLNRNFNANWGTVGVSFDSCSNTYCGTGPGSEPEAKSVMNFIGKMLTKVLCFLTIHSAGQLILLPYGHPQIKAPNYEELVSVGEAAAAEMKKVHGMSYTVGTSPQILYPNSGSSRDWARLSGIPFSYTFELRDKGEFSHLLPEDQIQPACEEAYAGALSIISYVHDKHFNNSTAPSAAAGLFRRSGVVLTLLSTSACVCITARLLSG